MIKKQFITIATFAGLFAVLSGCQMTNEKVSNPVASELNERTTALDLREAELDKKEQALKAQQERFVVGGVNWQSTLCNPQISTDRTIEIQKTLKEKGFNPGVIDGFIGKSTMKAINLFQEAHGLPVGNYISIETLKALDISGVSGY